MDSLQPYNQNNASQGSFLSSKYLNPEYLFNQVYGFFHNLFSYGISDRAINTLYFILFVFATFFLFIISYSAIRLLEIRKKERKHLEHEIAEYAHKKAELDKKRQAEGDGLV